MDIRTLITPAFRAEMAAMAEHDAIAARARNELYFARWHRKFGDRGLAAAYLDLAADARAELAKLGETK